MSKLFALPTRAMKCVPCLATAVLLAVAVAPAQGATLFATDATGALLRFDSSTPQAVTSVNITGLMGSESLLGIDFRPLTGQLYGLGSTSRLYTIDTTTGTATAVGAPGQFALSGTSFGFDFNPTVDRIRVVSNTRQDLRLNPINGALAMADPMLTYALTDSRAGVIPQVSSAGYTNSVANAASTTLYDIDAGQGTLLTQAPPNDGTLNTVGPLGVTVTGIGGFDILPVSGIAFAAFQTSLNGPSSLYTVNLATGSASLVGGIGTGRIITGLAAVSDVPEPSSMALFGLGGAMLVYLRRRAKA